MKNCQFKNPILIKRALTITASIFLFSACSKVVEAPVSGSSVDEVRFEKVSVRNFDQMNQTMSTLTGISSSLVSSKFSSDPNSGIRTSLPNDNSLKAFSGSQQGAVVKLASYYCEEFTKAIKVPSQTELSDFVFPKTIADLNTEKVSEISSKFYDKFWGSCINRPALSEVQSEMKSLVTDLKDLESVHNYMGVMCTVFLSSSCVTMF